MLHRRCGDRRHYFPSHHLLRHLETSVAPSRRKTTGMYGLQVPIPLAVTQCVRLDRQCVISAGVRVNITPAARAGRGQLSVLRSYIYSKLHFSLTHFTIVLRDTADQLLYHRIQSSSCNSLIKLFSRPCYPSSLLYPSPSSSYQISPSVVL